MAKTTPSFADFQRDMGKDKDQLDSVIARIASGTDDYSCGLGDPSDLPTGEIGAGPQGTEPDAAVTVCGPPDAGLLTNQAAEQAVKRPPALAHAYLAAEVQARLAKEHKEAIAAFKKSFTKDGDLRFEQAEKVPVKRPRGRPRKVRP